MSAKDLRGGRTEVLNVGQIKRLDHHPAGSDHNSAPESIPETENLLDWNEDLDNPNHSEDNWDADNESDIGLHNGKKDPQTPEHGDVNATPSIPGSIRPT